MAKTSIAMLAAMSLAAFGCRKDAAGDGRTAVAQITALKDKMCACTDKACSEKVSAELAEWGQGPDNAAGDKQVKAIKKEIAECLLKLEVPGTAAAAPAGTTDSAAPATGSAAAAAPAGAADSAQGSAAAGAAAGW